MEQVAGLGGLSAAALRLFGADVMTAVGPETVLSDSDRRLGPEFDSLDRAFGALGRTALVRDAAYLDWRFRRNPVDRHEFVLTWNGRDLGGYLTFAVRNRVALVKDWLALDDTSWCRLFAAALREFRRRRLLSVSVVMLEEHPDIRRLRRFGFVLRPETTTAISYASPAFQPRASVRESRCWYMTVGDRDL
jgi:hypothetical protein